MKREGGGDPPGHAHDEPHYLSEDFCQSGRRKRGRRKKQETEDRDSRKKIKINGTVSVIEELADDEEEMFDLLSARIKRCDVKIKTEDFSYYLQELGLEKVSSPDPNPNKVDTSSGSALEDEKEKVCEESSSKNSIEEVDADDDDDKVDEEDWYHGTTFTCSVCNYQLRVLKMFEKHVEEKHGCDLKQFSKKYKVSAGKYTCKICGSKVRHDKPDIDNHVQSHFLSLAKYGQLYEKKINYITERKRLKKEEKASASSDVGTSQVKETSSSTSDGVAPNNKAVKTGNIESNISKEDLVKSKEVLETVNVSSQETVKASVEPEFVENNNKTSEQPSEYSANLVDKDQTSFTIAEVNEVIHDLLSEEAEKSKSLVPLSLTPPPGPQPVVLEAELLKSPFPKSDDEIYIYCCPFQDCHFTCNFQARKCKLISLFLINVLL